MKFEYLFISYVQEKDGYRFYEKYNDAGIKVLDYREYLPVLNHYGQDGWEFICWDSGRLLFRRSY
ncbi:hypothetical protein [Cytobacillus kochii]|uniref:hypothetical protein n=1 Tax=Cytobacillus kochii TaxID=859143 RepID=UPI00402A8FCD